MKKVFLFVALASVMVACGSKQGSSSESQSDSVVVDSTAVHTEQPAGGSGEPATEEVVHPIDEKPIK